MIPSTMRAVHAEKPGGPEVLALRTIETPRPAPGEVLIEVEAAGVNRPDLRQRQGNYPPPPGVTEVLGLEVAGRVGALGDGVADDLLSTEICALVAGGGYAEYCVAPVEQVLPKPEALATIEAAALPETFFTVWTNLFRLGRLQPGESVLIHGGASGIGTTAIQLARAAGATVYCTAGGPEKVAACQRIGADAAIDYRSGDFSERVLELTGGKGVDVVLDLVCAAYAARNLRSLAVGGRLVIISFIGGGRAEIDLENLVRRRQSILGSTLRPQTPQEKGLIARDLRERVWPWIEEGKVRPVIQSVHALENAADAHRELEAGRHVGKIVLEVRRV